MNLKFETDLPKYIRALTVLGKNPIRRGGHSVQKPKCPLALVTVVQGLQHLAGLAESHRWQRFGLDEVDGAAHMIRVNLMNNVFCVCSILLTIENNAVVSVFERGWTCLHQDCTPY
jgi:hypothetical protein